MPEDHFGDLERGASRRGRAAERLSDLDERDREERDRAAAEPPPPRTGPRYSWVVAVAAFVAIVFAMYNLLDEGVGEGTRGPEPGATLPDFAAPSLDGDSQADANVRQGSAGSDAEGEVPACQVRGEGVVNICELRERPVVLTIVVGGCEEALDRVEAIRGDYPEVSFVGLITSEDREGAEALAAGHDWGFPVGLDPDHAVFNLYRGGDCPTTVFAEAGGEVTETRLGSQSEEALRSAVERVARTGGSR